MRQHIKDEELFEDTTLKYKKLDSINVMHLVSNWNYNVIESYIRFINENFEIDDHLFVVLDEKGNIPNEILKHVNVIDMNLKSIKHQKKLNFMLTRANKILLHGLSLRWNLLLKIIIRPNIMNKIIWIAWGADLYQDKIEYRKNVLMNFKIMIFNLLGSKFRRRISKFVGIFPPDITYFKEKYNTSAKVYHATYTGPLFRTMVEENSLVVQDTLKEKNNRNEWINIQIGHSSAEILNHLEVLEELKKFEKEKIKIYIPLSYGDRDYAQLVEKNAKDIFGDKAIIMRKMLSKNDYLDHLSKMDIIIFNTPRQIGLGNLTPLLYMKKKIFIPKDTVMYNYFVSENINICDYNDVLDTSFEKFIEPINMDRAKKYVEENDLNLAKSVNSWGNIFQSFKKEDK